MRWELRHRAAKVTLFIPGRCAASNPESRDSGSGANAPSRNDGALNLPTPDRRHHHFVAAAAAAVDFLAGAELQVPAQADPDFAQPFPATGHRDRRAREAWIDLDEGGLYMVGRDRLPLRSLQEC